MDPIGLGVSMKNNAKELYGVQILRGVAALAVVLHHSLEESNGAVAAFSPDWLTTFGAAGVDIFFVISGFIMLYTSFPAARSPLSPGNFIFRRITRIYPLYWLCCLPILGIMLAGFLRNNRLDPHEIALSLALLPSSKLIIGVSWTLVYEMYFYLIFAATLLFRSALISAISTTVVITILALVGNVLEPGETRSFLTNPIAYEFVLGLWLAIAFVRAEAIGKRWLVSPAWAVLGFALVVLAPVYVSHTTTANLPGWPRVFAWGLPAMLIVAAFLSIDRTRNNFQLQMAFLGDSSYALYLTHIFVMIGYGLLLKRTVLGLAPQIAIVLLIILLAVGVGIFTHSTVERPLIRMSRRWMRRERLVLEEYAGRNGLVSNQQR